MDNNFYSKFIVVAFFVLPLISCKSTNEYEIRNGEFVEATLRPTLQELTESDRSTFLQLLVNHYGTITNQAPGNFQVVTFDTSYQINTPSGRLVVALSVAEDYSLKMQLYNQCPNCDARTFELADTLYKNTVKLWKEHGSDFRAFVIGYDAFEKDVEKRVENLKIQVLDPLERLSTASRNMLESSITVKPVVIKTKKETFRFDNSFNFDEAIQLAIIDTVSVGRLKVSYTNLATTVSLKNIKDPFIAYVKDLSADLLPSSYEMENDDLKLKFTGKSIAVSNRTSSFIEFENISVYYGDSIFTVRTDNDLLPPLSKSIEVISKLSLFNKYPHNRMVKIHDSKQEVPFGFALKYKVDNEQRTFFETTNVLNTTFL